MRLEGFIGAAYQLDSVNVDNQRCVNLYPEVIESGKGKAGQVAYLRGTPGLEEFLEVGSGPIRCVHVDSIGRRFIVSGNQVFLATPRDEWNMKFTPPAFDAIASIDQSTFVDTTNNEIDCSHPTAGYYTGLKVRVSSSSTLPTGLVAGTDYWVIVVDSDSLSLATTLANAIAGTAIDITATGSGNLTITPQIPDAITNIDYDNGIDITTSTFSKLTHNFYTGLKVRFATTGAVPTGLTNFTDYYVIKDSADTFRLATSPTNASGGTEVEVTAVGDDEWATILLGADGLDGGTAVTLSSNTGLVKAASMSLGGDGRDSSTIFVDGVDNYLYRDEEATDSFGRLSDTATEAVLNITNDLTVWSPSVSMFNGANLHVFSQSFALPTSTVLVSIGASISNGVASDVYITVVTNDGTNNLGVPVTLTTAELATVITLGSSSLASLAILKNVTIQDNQNIISLFNANGGGAESCLTEFGTTVSDVFEQVTYEGFGEGSVPTATDIGWTDGYFVVTEGGTNKFYISNLQGFSIDALDFTSSEGDPDIVVALAVLQRDLYIFNEKTTEVYANTGNADFPFERIQGGFIDVGCLAKGSVVNIGGQIAWLGRSKDGQGIVYAIQGLQPRRISTHAIEQQIRGYEDPEGAVAWGYQSGGHVFYALNFAEATWVYDFSTGLWHERGYLSDGNIGRHRLGTLAYVPRSGELIGGDYETNQLYFLKEDVYTDAGDAILRLRTTPHYSAGRNWVFCSSFWLDMEVGIGLDGGVQGSIPTVMLDWSNDGGHVWSSEQWALADAGAGQIGDYSKRVIWNRLGKYRQRVFRIKITDPVKVRLIDAQIEAEIGAS